MPKFLNRLLALPIAEQNALFAALEARIEANIEHAIEAGTFERGVETIAADSLSTGARETVFVTRLPAPRPSSSRSCAATGWSRSPPARRLLFMPRLQAASPGSWSTHSPSAPL